MAWNLIGNKKSSRDKEDDEGNPMGREDPNHGRPQALETQTPASHSLHIWVTSPLLSTLNFLICRMKLALFTLRIL